MATPGELTRTISATTGVSQPTVEQFDRALGNAGLRSKAGRGAAPQVNAVDAARLLTALLAAESPQDAAEVVKKYAATAETGYLRDRQRFSGKLESKSIFAGFAVPQLAALPVDHSFVDAFAAVIEAAADARNDILQMVEVSASSRRTVGTIRIPARGTALLLARYQLEPMLAPAPLTRTSTVYGEPLLTIAALLARRPAPFE